MFFEKFPLLQYTLDNNKSFQLVPDILRRVALADKLKQNSSYFEEYDIRDGETPEIVAEKKYGDSQLHWIILMANDIIDPRFDWHLSYYNLVEYCKGKYGAGNINKLHHYVNQQEYIVNGYRSMREDSTFLNPGAIELEQSNQNIQVNLVLQNFQTGKLFPVSNLMYEDSQNEKRRRINIIRPQIVSTIETSFNSLITA
jgi:hypothetical protein